MSCQSHNILASEINKYEQWISAKESILIREYRIAQLYLLFTGSFIEGKP